MAQSTWKGPAVSSAVRSKALQALVEGANIILDGSNQIAPIDEGTLIASGDVTLDEGSATATISYSAPYALIQHERGDFKHRNGRKSKFLETSYKENLSRVQQHIASAIKSVIE